MYVTHFSPGGSVVESLTGDANILGRRSSYEVVEARSSRMSLQNIEAAEPEWESANAKLHSLRLLVLDQLVRIFSIKYDFLLDNIVLRIFLFFVCV